jgi:hypothetical protein
MCNHHGVHKLPLRRRVSTAVLQADCCTAELELLAAVDALGYPASIFPGDETARADIDRSIERLEAATPSPSPLRPPSPALLGDWQLVYASDGTYVTRTGAAQALLAASQLPGVGVADIRQALQLPGDADDPANTGSSSAGSSGGGGGGSGGGGTQLRTSNAACFGLGPLGEWEVCIQGVWDVVDASLARVSFTGFDLQLTGLFGVLKLPRMAKVCMRGSLCGCQCGACAAEGGASGVSWTPRQPEN